MSRQASDNDRDPRVADVYRATADERTPDHLNSRIMRMAAKADRTRYFAARAWLRPAAWAVTIGLSFALVLDITLLPLSTPGQEQLARPTVALPADHVEQDAAPDLETPAASGTGTPASRTAKAPLAEKWRATALPSKAGPGPVSQQDEHRADADAYGLEDRAPDQLAAEAATPEAKRLHAGQPSDNIPRLCPPDVRNAPDSWYDCIKSLPETLPEALLRAELDALFATFPEFEPPPDE
jgi:hypothetical protein